MISGENALSLYFRSTLPFRMDISTGWRLGSTVSSLKMKHCISRLCGVDADAQAGEGRPAAALGAASPGARASHQVRHSSVVGRHDGLWRPRRLRASPSQVYRGEMSCEVDT